MDAARRVLPAPRKDLNKIRKRPRSVKPTPVSTAAATTSTTMATTSFPTIDTSLMDFETLLATLTADDDNAQMEFPTKPAATRVNYYVEVPTPASPTPPQPELMQPTPSAASAVEVKKKTEKKRKKNDKPRMLIRQAYKLGPDTGIVIGLESVRDYKPSICLVNDYSSVDITMSDFISLRSANIQATVDRYFNEAKLFKPVYLRKCVIELGGENTINIYSHHIVSEKSCWWNKKSVHSDECKKEGVQLDVSGWNSFKRHFDCIENYYTICAECSDTVQHLLQRYTNFLTKHYRAETFLAAGNIISADIREITLSPEYGRHITNDVPMFLQDLNEKRLPPAPDASVYQLTPPHHLTPTRQALLPWIDSEVRRYCAPYLTRAVLENLKNHYIW